MTFTDKGIVLRAAKSGEYGKTLTVLFQTRGKLTISAKGTQKPNGKMTAACEVFCFSEFVVYETSAGGFLSATQATRLDGFFNVSADYERYVCASLIAELLDKMSVAGVPYGVIFRLCAYALKSAEKHENPKIAAAVFAEKLAIIEGFAPNTIEANEAVAYAYSFVAENDAPKIFSFSLSKKDTDIYMNKVLEILEESADVHLVSADML
ncbi:hypothetical protein FACS189490_09970 [Clostridia bacterium]|nr:hypothetical protein FACS189490_09970 [Clostridia bacterium]